MGERGDRFYFNREERQSTWTEPRPAKCQILFLRTRMLRLLQSSAGGTQGFADKPEKLDVMPRFAGLNNDFDDQSFKRAKVGSEENAGQEGGRERAISVSPSGSQKGSD